MANESEETTEQQFQGKDEILKAIADLSHKIDDYKKEYDLQFEAVRQGIVLNSVRFDRLEAKILNLNADFTELSEEMRKKEPVM